MIASVFRHSRRKDGRRVIGRTYWAQLRLNPTDKLERFSLHTTDKRVAEKRLREIVEEREREAAGILSPKPQREAAGRPLADHLKDYLADMKARQRSQAHTKHVRLRLNRLLHECGWTLPKDVSADSFMMWRAKETTSPKTVNEYLSAAHCFMEWMHRAGRTPLNPLSTVQRAETRGAERIKRRALTDEEVRSLLAVAGRRAVIYLAALHTGLRYGELKQLQWGDLHLDAAQPYLMARASTTKNRKDAAVFLPEELVEAFRAMRTEEVREGAKVFKGIMPIRKTWRADFDAAGIARADDRGRRADFHALRHTLASNLARAGVPPRLAMEIMRHSDLRLTVKTYTDAAALPTAAVVAAMPRFTPVIPAAGSPPQYAQIDAQRLDAPKQDLAFGGASALPTTIAEMAIEVLDLEGDGRDLAGGVIPCQNANEKWSQRNAS